MNRWWIILAGTVLQLCLGTVYAWSYFQKPLVDTYGWSNSSVSLTFSLTICFLGLAAAWGGTQLPRFGPRKLAVAGGLLFGLGYLLAAVALHYHSLALLYVGYGVVGGSGLGLGYVTPVATVAKWFPDKKGLATGTVIMGFGFGALLMSKRIAPVLVHHCNGDFVAVFAWLGVVLGGATSLVALFLCNPPIAPADGAQQRPQQEAAPADFPVAQFVLMWSVFFCNIVAGISIISFQSPLLQNLWKARDPAATAEMLAVYGANLIAVSSLLNGLGRMFWGGLSDRLGRLATFRVMLVSQIAVFALLAMTGNPWLFAALVCYVLLCYGGGFGTMPSFVLDEFGPKRMAAVYGAMLTAWSAGGMAGPQMVAFLTDHYGPAASRYTFTAAGVFVTLGFLLTLAIRPAAKPAGNG